jgi:hypothetical protein
MRKITLYFILSIIVVSILIFSLCQNRPVKITPEAEQEFINYIKMHEVAEEHEVRCSGIADLINNIDTYFEYKLKDSIHKEVISMLRSNNNTMTKEIMDRWVWENYVENYIKKNHACS